MTPTEIRHAIYQDIENAITDEWLTVSEIKARMKHPTRAVALHIVTLLKQNIIEVKYREKDYLSNGWQPLYRRKKQK